ncbi:MAG: glucokinase [Planctomycetes bacterium]|nr:glucokinase [Planctomycetota bacterium]
MRVLAGDIGGTNARFAIWEPGARQPLFAHQFRDIASAAGGLDELLGRFQELVRAELGIAPAVPVAASACVGVAGPIEAGVCRATNLPWVVDAAALARSTGIERFALINDFVAMASAVPELGPGDVVTLGGTAVRERAPIAVVGPGTGLGVGFLYWPEGGTGYTVIASEGGHADFAPRTALEASLLRFLAARHGRVSIERVLSGPGLAAIFDFLCEEDCVRRQLAPGTAQAFAGAGDPAAVVTARALAGSDPVCAMAVEMFAALLGAVAGNLALTVLARGGVFIGGGIAPRLVELLPRTGLREAFEQKGRFAELLRPIPLQVIVHPQPGLLGAAAQAARL